MDYRQSHLAWDKGQSYDRKFSANSHRSMMWQMEKGILDQIIRTYFDGRSIRHLDFACGTGRVLTYLEPYADESVGVDVSPSMLDVARRHIAKATIIEADLTREDALLGRKFNLITAFRFFPNAQAELRAEAVKILVSHLEDDGYLIFNNHLNNSSLLLRLARVTRRAKGLGMARAEVVDLVDSAGLKIVTLYHLGVMPSNERYLLLPLAVLGPLERFAARHEVFRNLSQNLIYVCSRSGR